MLAMLALYLMVTIEMIFENKPGYFELERNIYELKTCWSYIRKFFEIFGIQIYFLWTL